MLITIKDAPTSPDDDLFSGMIYPKGLSKNSTCLTEYRWDRQFNRSLALFHRNKNLIFELSWLMAFNWIWIKIDLNRTVTFVWSTNSASEYVTLIIFIWKVETKPENTLTKTYTKNVCSFVCFSFHVRVRHHDGPLKYKLPLRSCNTMPQETVSFLN